MHVFIWIDQDLDPLKIALMIIDCLFLLLIDLA